MTQLMGLKRTYHGKLLVTISNHVASFLAYVDWYYILRISMVRCLSVGKVLEW